MRRTRWTIHALRAMEDRYIEISDVEKTLNAPDMVAIDPPLRAVFMRRYLASDLGRVMLLRVVVEETSTEREIITGNGPRRSTGISKADCDEVSI